MRTLYLDCGMGAAGDMLSAALFDLLDREAQLTFLEKMNGLGIPGVEYRAVESCKCGIVGTQMRVLVHGEEECAGSHASEEGQGKAGKYHVHRAEKNREHVEAEKNSNHEHMGLHNIESVIVNLPIDLTVKNHALEVYKLLADAESQVHGRPVDEIHFHEVGNLDAIADVVCVSALLEELKVDRVLASPVHVGAGQVSCAHGILPVPAPATALLLKGLPIYGGEIQAELCTPTGAALLKHFVSEFGAMPVMTVESIGYGMGHKDFKKANCVRAFLGEDYGEVHGEPRCEVHGEVHDEVHSEVHDEKKDSVIELSCNLDDMSPEAIAFTSEVLLEAGALDVYTIAIGMKKGRPGVMLNVLCKPEDEETVTKLIFRHTTTIGIRKQTFERSVLEREAFVKETSFGPVRGKRSYGYGVLREKLEYEDLAAIAKREGLSLAEVQEQG